jgi:hypothetical protein
MGQYQGNKIMAITWQERGKSIIPCQEQGSNIMTRRWQEDGKNMARAWQ